MCVNGLFQFDAGVGFKEVLGGEKGGGNGEMKNKKMRMRVKIILLIMMMIIKT